MNSNEKIVINRVTREDKQIVNDLVSVEFPFTIIVNDRELVTMLCTPSDFTYLTVGFLVSEGFLKKRIDIKKLLVDEERGIARIEIIDNDMTNMESFKRFISSGCGRGATFYSATDIGYARITSQSNVSANEIISLVKEFQNRSQNYRVTGGVHSAALCDSKRIIVFHEDIGRHNAVDKVFGQCLMEDIPTENHMIITSGRITSEILLKVIKRNIPLLVSKSAPTNLAVRLAIDSGVTLIGFVRGVRMNVYAHDERIITSSKQSML